MSNEPKINKYYTAAVRYALSEGQNGLPLFLTYTDNVTGMFSTPAEFTSGIQAIRALCAAQAEPINEALMAIRFVISPEAQEKIGYPKAVFVFAVSKDQVHFGIQGYNDAGETADSILWDEPDVLAAAGNLTKQMQLWITPKEKIEALRLDTKAN